MSKLSSRVKAFLTSRDFIVNFFIGGQNFGAGLTTFGNAINNYLAYPLTLRLVGVMIIQAVLGASIAVLELFPHPDFLDRHANFLNTYFGRSALYLAIALISADSIEVKSEHNWYLYMTWLGAGSVAASSAFFFAVGAYSLLWKPLPVSRSMTTSAEAAKYNASKGGSVVLGMSRSAKGMMITRDNKAGQASREEASYGYALDQGAVSRSGWTQTAVTDHKSKVPLSSIKIKPDWSDYSIDMTTSSYAHQIATSDSRLQWIKTEISPTTPDENFQRAQHRVSKRLSNNPFRTLKYNTEASSSKDQLISTLASERQSTRKGSRVTFQDRSKLCSEMQAGERADWTPFTTSHDDDGQDGNESSRKHLSRRAKRRSSHHKRVFVPGVGSFDLSSGSDDSEGEQEDIAYRTMHQDGDDNESVYSVNSETEADRSEAGKPARLGRKLTRKETLTYRGKLNRGMQRALSQRQSQQQRTAGDGRGNFI